MVISEGSKAAQLSETDIRGVLERSLASDPLDGKRVLVIIPDHTRSGPTGLFFRAVSESADRIPVRRCGCGHSGKRKELDLKKDKTLTELGWKILRFTNKEIMNNVSKVLFQIKTEIGVL